MKYLNKNLYKGIAMLFVTLGFMSCDDFLDINDDPNNPTSVGNALLLSSAQVNMAYAFGNDNAGLNGHAGTIMHHYVQRGAINDYGIQGTDFAVTTPWRSLYAGALTDLNIIIESGTEAGDLEFVGIAQVMKSFIFASMVDVWGDVPYFEANLGSENPFPTFDGGQEIYTDVLSLLDMAITNLAGGGTDPGASDFMYGGDQAAWIRVANTLKFRMYNNMNQLAGGFGTELQALVNGGNLIGNLTQDWEFGYGTSFTPENRNPAFAQEWSIGGAFYYIDPFFYETMRNADSFGHGGLLLGVSDPRIPYYFYNQLPFGAGDGDAENPVAYGPSSSGSAFLSIYSYSFNIDPNEGFDQSSSQTVAGLYATGGAYDAGAGGVVSNAATLAAGQVTGLGIMAQRLLTFDELLYMQAELAQLGQITVTGETARSLLGLAIDASFAKLNQVAAEGGAPLITDASRDAYRDAVLVAFDGATDPLQVIMTSKWVSMFGNSLVSYNDYRRTGYPVLHDGNTDNLNVTVQTRAFPVSFPYDVTNLTLNPNAPAQRIVATANVFWQ